MCSIDLECVCFALVSIGCLGFHLLLIFLVVCAIRWVMCPPFSSVVPFGFFTTPIPLGIVPYTILDDCIWLGWLILNSHSGFGEFVFSHFLSPSFPSLLLLFCIGRLAFQVAFFDSFCNRPTFAVSANTSFSCGDICSHSLHVNLFL